MSNPNLFTYSSAKATQQQTIDATAGANTIVPPLTVIEPDNAYHLLPQASFLDTASNNNSVSLAAKSIKTGSDEFASFTALPVILPADALMTEMLSNWDNGNYGSYVASSVAGIYKQHSTDTSAIQGSPSGHDVSKIIDSDFNTSLRLSFIDTSPSGIGATESKLLGIKFLFPTINTTTENAVDFDQVSIGIRCRITSPNNGTVCNIRGYARQYGRTAAKMFEIADAIALGIDATTGPTDFYFDSIMDAYYQSNKPSTNDYNFGNKGQNSLRTSGMVDYTTAPPANAATAPATWETTGYQFFPLTTLTKDNYRTYGQGAVLIEIKPPYTGSVATPLYATITRLSAYVVQLGTTGTFATGDTVFITNSAGDTVGPMTISSFDSGSKQATLSQDVSGFSFGGTVYIFKNLIQIDIYELCVVYHSSASVKDAVYAPMSGRTFGGPAGTYDGIDTVGNVWKDGTARAGRVPTAMIADPVDMLEHVLRLQNWSEVAVPAFTVGKQYDPHALIKTGTDIDGSFVNAAALGAYGSTTFGQVRACRPAFQIFDDGKGWTDTIARQLCKSFGLLSYIDAQGYECVGSFAKQFTGTGAPAGFVSNKNSGPLGLTFTELAERPGKVYEPQIADVFCEPTVEYGYDPGPGTYQQFLVVSNTNQATWQAAYTPGYENVTPGSYFQNTAGTAPYDPFGLLGASGYMKDGEYIWTVCHQLYLKHGQVEKCPSDFTEQPMISIYPDALYYVSYKLQIMRYRRIAVSTFYTKGRPWHIFQHLKVLLPAISATDWKEVLIEKITIQKAGQIGGRVRLGLVILDK